MSKLNKLVAEIIAELLKENPDLLVRRKLSYNEPSLYKNEGTASDSSKLKADFKKLTGKELTNVVKFTSGEASKILNIVQALNKKYGDERFGKSPLYIKGNDVLFKEAYSCDECGDDEVITESSSYVCVTCGERAEHEEIEDNPRMRCPNCGGNQWRIAEVGIEESSTTGGVDGYMTPNAFAAPGQDPKKKKAVRAMDWPVVESVDFKDPEMSPKKKIAYAVKGMREQLMEIENVLDKSVNFKEEAGLKTSDFYKRTHKNLRKIGEQITRIMNKMQTIK